MNESKIRVFSEEELMEIAKKRIRVKRELSANIAAYVFVNAFLILIYLFSNDFTFGPRPWFIWIMVAWGLFLSLHAFGAYQDLKYKYNAGAIEREINKIKKDLK
jgi:hypothetical protein